MTDSEFFSALRAATEDDVEAALVDAMVRLPITTPTELLEAFNCIVDLISGERVAAEMADDEMVARVRAATVRPRPSSA
jgi:hypothetical protein